jgi:hypothetical protein
MKTLIAVLALLLFSGIAAGQTATFAFGSGTPCEPITQWNGVPNAYPDAMGAICLTQGDPYGGYGSYLDIPFQLGFSNDGYWAGCNPITWGPKVFTIGNGTHTGDAFTVNGSTSCPTYGANAGFTVVVNYTVMAYRSCNRGRCVNSYVNSVTNGTGEAYQ